MCRMIPDLRSMPYRDQLSSLHLYSLQTRRLRYQLIMIFKLYKRLTDLDFNTFFEIADHNRTRGHKAKIIPKFAKNNYRINFFQLAYLPLEQTQ